MTAIGVYAFQACTSLTFVSLGNSVTSIGERAFYRCTKLPSITIPKSVTSIGQRAFYSCDSLSSVIVAWEEPIALNGSTASTFSNNLSATLYVPQGTTAAYSSSNYWKKFGSIVEYEMGDIDGDGDITTNDVEVLADIVAGNIVRGCNTNSADVNDDGQISVADITALVNKVRSI